MSTNKPKLYIGVDVGGTKTEVCLISMPGRKVHSRERIHTNRHATFPEFLKELKELIERVLVKSDLNVSLTAVDGIGMGLPGSVDPRTHVMAQGSISFLKNQKLEPAVREAFQYQGPLHFDNDANCFALAEAYFGAGHTWATQNQVPLDELCLVGITLGTGVGGGLIVNGNLIRGRRGGAGEIGHVTLIESGYPCYCGKFGCSEQYLSGTAFERAYATRASALHHLKGSEIFKIAENRDPLAIATIEYYRDHLVTFLSNVANFLDPHVIVLGGGMSTQKRIYPGISERLSKGCFLTENPPAVLQNECGESAGVVGAALLSLFEKKEHHDHHP